MHSSGYLSQSMMQRNRSQDIQPMGGVLASPLSNASAFCCRNTQNNATIMLHVNFHIFICNLINDKLAKKFIGWLINIRELKNIEKITLLQILRHENAFLCELPCVLSTLNEQILMKQQLHLSPRFICARVCEWPYMLRLRVLSTTLFFNVSNIAFPLLRLEFF